ncbi:enoyl-CoA hydratase family protein [Nocardia sp. NRRL S-836]|uniref:enoyl-CoA hydratase family protein n=1 Tax=Nocardia sp. NRRL S-836 TaxID=1519492 RepID=UPI0006AF4080|nr:enoyl-CoA hydratase family protein [Nocardia sp. NRRL S-836]KOV86829.1 enoyl-CoA hydratase [Nocardia sp. NRRL S-836]
MGISSSHTENGVVEVTIDFPPVNALPARGWFELADTITRAGDDQDARVVVLRAENRGFCAGVDLKEMQRAPGYEALVAANRGCARAFGAVYDCAVPVVAAVHGFCLGGGVGLVGNADVVIASDDAYFGLPEVDRGALGAATHLARLVPQHLMRALYYTASNVTAAQLHHHGSVYRVVPHAELDDAARELAHEIAKKDPLVIRRAKEAINGIDPQRVHTSYRFEQGFTFELNLTGASDRARQAFLDGHHARQANDG